VGGAKRSSAPGAGFGGDCAASVRPLTGRLHTFGFDDVDLAPLDSARPRARVRTSMDLAFELSPRWAGSTYTPSTTGGLTDDRNLRRSDRCHF